MFGIYLRSRAAFAPSEAGGFVAFNRCKECMIFKVVPLFSMDAMPSGLVAHSRIRCARGELLRKLDRQANGSGAKAGRVGRAHDRHGWVRAR